MVPLADTVRPVAAAAPAAAPGVTGSGPLLSRTKSRYSSIAALPTGKTGQAPGNSARPLCATLYEPEYQSDIVEHMHTMEKQTVATVELMDLQPELQWFMRPYLVDFLIEIHQSFRLRPETLYLTMNMVDRYVSKRIVYKRHYQLVGCAALLIAAKFEDAKDSVPTVQELSQMCCNAYDTSAFTQMEGHVLFTLDWRLGHPAAETWLRYEHANTPPSNPSTYSVARFLLETTLFSRSFIGVLPSMLAAGALLLARHICRDPRTAAHACRTAALMAEQIHTHVLEQLGDISVILVKKYASPHHACASTVALEWFRKRAEMCKTGGALAHPYRQEMYSSDEDGDSEQSNSSVSSLFSTPSRSATRDDDDEDSLPMTPLSLNIGHDNTLPAPPAPRFPSGPSAALSAKRASHGDLEQKQMHAQWVSINQLKPVAKPLARPSRYDMDVDMPPSERV
ncbi:hypothetical protein MSPP1_000223 [Malassezia sp. CBS 17886]|nr:hypothetical protein MSPP1_000223 [Malassezia sp. CBS 17886]